MWALHRDAFESLQQDAPAVASALLVYLSRIQAERLAFATRRIGALQAKA